MFNRLFIIILISYLFFALNSCSISKVMYPSQLGQGEFYAIQFKGGDKDNQQSIILKPRKILSKERVEVYLDDKGSNISDESIEYIIKGFEKAYKGMLDTFGTHTDVDSNGKIIIIFFDINMGIVETGEYIAGYFYSADLIKGYGNGAEILYVDSANVDEKNREAVLGTVVHEFQHLIDYNMNNVRFGKSSDLWINEARSEAANIIYAQNGNMPNNRLRIYNGDNTKIKNGNYFYKWDNITDTATASLFMYWLYVQGKNEVDGIEKGIIHDIAYSRQSYDYRSVAWAVNKISKFANASWDDILLAWLLSNQINEQTGLDGYKDLTLNQKLFTGGVANLYPGDAIITTKEPTFSSPNIRMESGSGIFITLNKSTSMRSDPVRVSVSGSAEQSLEGNNNQNFTPLAKTSEDRIKHISQGDIKGKF